MMRIVRVVCEDVNGKRHEFTGTGEMRLVTTATEVEGLPPGRWPVLKYVAAHLVVTEP